MLPGIPNILTWLSSTKLEETAEYTEYVEGENVNVLDSAYFEYSAVQKIEAICRRSKDEANPAANILWKFRPWNLELFWMLDVGIWNFCYCSFRFRANANSSTILPPIKCS